MIILLHFVPSQKTLVISKSKNKNINFRYLSFPKLPSIKSLRDLFDWPKQEFYRVPELATSYVGHFHECLIRGGFPQTAQVDSIHQAQRLLRDDIIDKVLKRDMTAIFGVLRTSACTIRYYPLDVRFTYWRGSKDHEVDLVAEVKYR